MAAFIDFSYVKQHASFEAVLSRYGIALRGRGDERSALCPFHEESKPSFKVNIAKRAFQCFGCGVKGNVLEFVAKKEGCELREAAQIVAECSGVGLSERTEGASAAVGAQQRDNGQEQQVAPRQRPLKPQRQSRKAEAPSQERNPPLTFRLKLDPEHAYLCSRLSPFLIAHFETGYCDRGLMKGRIAIPIHDDNGELVAYAGRWASDEVPDEVEKYLLPPSFRKSLVLFNAWRLEPPAEHVVLVEGYFGAMRLHGLGIPVVALMGCSIAEEQIALLQSLGVRRLSLMMDGDAPGRTAALEMLPLLARSVFTRICVLPEGEQPDTVSEEAIRELVEPVSP